jgi:hypothetical protein
VNDRSISLKSASVLAFGIPPRLAFEELEAEPLLRVAQHVAHGRLRHVQTLGRAGGRACQDHRVNDLDMAKAQGVAHALIVSAMTTPPAVPAWPPVRPAATARARFAAPPRCRKRTGVWWLALSGG